MITILIIFSLIAYFDWRYLQQNKRTKRAVIRVMAVACVLTLGMEAIYLLRDRWTVGMLIESIFFPLQKLIFVETHE
ncbi:hypothetical protein SD71_06045 [Cohnella kolymensis]|uniref:Histidine kinase n=1 Tax=Cohnella kolymensis TaxID=1590652 RepID=A0ABR5A679_9BACL|nr:hypothetical protein [Cohnella kolymensis]KIL36586.1 hypothetical protein SD71_06045 [Cohnella kolymensis]